MSESIQLVLAGTIFIGSTIVVIRHFILRRRACTGSCSTCPRGGTGPGACERASSSNSDLTQIREQKKQ